MGGSERAGVGVQPVGLRTPNLVALNCAAMHGGNMNTASAAPMVPDLLMPWLKPGAAAHLRFSKLTDRAFRVEVVDSPEVSFPGPLAMVGFARQFNQDPILGTDELMQELREGDAD